MNTYAKVMKSILVPTDFSFESTNALDFAMQLALKTNAEIKLLHVIEFPSRSFKITRDVQAGIRALGNVYADQLMNAIKSSLKGLEEMVFEKNIKVTSKIEMGNMYKHIFKIVSGKGADVIVMGTEGVTGSWKETLFGTSAERVIRNSHAPVFTVREKVDLSKVKKLVYAIGNYDDRSVSFVKELQKVLNFNCHLLKVYNPTKLFNTEDKANKDVTCFANHSEFINFTTHVTDAPWVEEGVLDFVNYNQMDMIAVSIQKQKSLLRFFNRNHADITDHAKVPLLTIRVD